MPSYARRYTRHNVGRSTAMGAGDGASAMVRLSQVPERYTSRRAPGCSDIPLKYRH